MKKALFLGRFQPFHKGHLHVVKELSNDYHIIIGIGSSEQCCKKKNPFSGKERKEMISKCLKNRKISNFSIKLIPDIGNNSKYVRHVESIVKKIDIVFSLPVS